MMCLENKYSNLTLGHANYKSAYFRSICGRFSPGTPVSSTNKTDRNDITEILLKVALNTTTLIPIFDLAPLARFK
jgi:hypothetical protein